MYRLPSHKRAGDQYVLGLVIANLTSLANKAKAVSTMEAKNKKKGFQLRLRPNGAAGRPAPSHPFFTSSP